jgi:SNF2 family DNA or RNA helicase
VQTIALLAALFHKTGTGHDLVELSRRKKLVDARISMIHSEKEKALLESRVYVKKNDDDFLRDLKLPAWSPVLIVAPNSVVTNWIKDFKTWAHFSVAVYQGSQSEREAALESVENGVAEVLVCGQSMIQGKKGFHALNTTRVKWKVVVVDEFHTFKNENKQLATNLREMRDGHQCIVVGLTGTVMQNNHKELWNLVDLAAKGHFGPWSQFELEFARPIKLSRYDELSRQTLLVIGRIRSFLLLTQKHLC